MTGKEKKAAGSETLELGKPIRTCTAHKSNGQPCKAPAIRGANVCRVHGGSAPQVKRKAEERLAALVDPSIAQLQKLIRARSEMVSLLTCKDVLDRNGFKPADKLELSGEVSIADRLAAARKRVSETAKEQG